MCTCASNIFLTAREKERTANLPGGVPSSKSSTEQIQHMLAWRVPILICSHSMKVLHMVVEEERIVALVRQPKWNGWVDEVTCQTW